MSVAAPPPAPALVPAGHRFRAYTALRPFSVVEYERMIDSGILTDEDKVELLDGHVVLKMPSNAPHASAIQSLTELLPPLLPVGWSLRGQQAILLPTSAPEPDIALVRGSSRDYRARHPNAAEAALVIEIADSSLDRDRHDKGPLYASAGLPVYWIVNLVDQVVEVYTSPKGARMPLTTPISETFTPAI